MDMLQCINLVPHGPCVSFDIELGEKIPKGRVLDFSERQFRMLCEEVAPTVPDAAERARIVVTTKRISGFYDDQTGIMEVEYDTKLRRTNEALRHETSHYLDDQKNQVRGHAYYQLVKRLYRVGVWTFRAALLTGGVCADMYVINDIQNTAPPEELYTALESVGVAGIAGALMVLSYRLHPEELRADRTSRKYGYLNSFSLRYAAEYMLIQSG